MKLKNTNLKAIFFKSDGDLKSWVMFVIYVWFVFLALMIALELAR